MIQGGRVRMTTFAMNSQRPSSISPPLLSFFFFLRVTYFQDHLSYFWCFAGCLPWYASQQAPDENNIPLHQTIPSTKKQDQLSPSHPSSLCPSTLANPPVNSYLGTHTRSSLYEKWCTLIKYTKFQLLTWLRITNRPVGVAEM